MFILKKSYVTKFITLLDNLNFSMKNLKLNFSFATELILYFFFSFKLFFLNYRLLTDYKCIIKLLTIDTHYA